MLGKELKVLNEFKMNVENKVARIPGVPYDTKDGQKFYVDILWAMVLGSKQELDSLLQLDQSDLDNRLRELSLNQIMVKAYTIANFLILKNEGVDTGKEGCCKKIIDFYYHTLSPLCVPWQLDHPKSNRAFANFTNVGLDVLINLLNLNLLDGGEVFIAKNRLIDFKGVHYQGQSNAEIKHFLEEYRVQN